MRNEEYFSTCFISETKYPPKYPFAFLTFPDCSKSMEKICCRSLRIFHFVWYFILCVVTFLFTFNVDCWRIGDFCVHFDVIFLNASYKINFFPVWTVIICQIKCFLLQLCHKLATDVDYIRREYWNYISRTLKEKFGQTQ